MYFTNCPNGRATCNLCLLFYIEYFIFIETRDSGTFVGATCFTQTLMWSQCSNSIARRETLKATARLRDALKASQKDGVVRSAAMALQALHLGGTCDEKEGIAPESFSAQNRVISLFLDYKYHQGHIDITEGSELKE